MVQKFIFKTCAKKDKKITTEAFRSKLYSPDVTHGAFFFSLTDLSFWDQVFKACLNQRSKLELTKYAYILVQQGHVYATGNLYHFVNRKFAKLSSPSQFP